GLPGAEELVSVPEDPGVKVRPDVWVQSRIAALVARAKPEQRRLLDDEIVGQWQVVQSAGTESVKRFVALYGSVAPAGAGTRWRLAGGLVEQPEQGGVLEAELHLLALADGPDQSAIRARAVEALARLLTRQGLMEDALHYYDLLGRDYARVVVRDGKTGADLR